jgi:transcriptional regulator with XRE-family HTH domain
MELGDLIKAKRKEKKLTQRKLAAIIKVNYVQICNYEKGKVKPTQSIMEKISGGLDIPKAVYEKYFIPQKNITKEELESAFKMVLKADLPLEDRTALHSICVSLLGHNLKFV